jgi:hypothetical protein
MSKKSVEYLPAFRGELVQRGIDQAQAGLAVLGLVDLIGDRDQPCPLRATE